MDNKHYANELDASFWNERWINKQTGWDVGYATPPITEFMKQYENKHAAILIPGCGNAYEAEFLIANGFTNITLLDIAEEAVKSLTEKFQSSTQINIVCDDFFHHQKKYDVIIEQTFFCAQVLERREEYIKKVHSLLNNNGQLIGVLFGITFEKEGPPFGGDIITYQQLFEPYFSIKTMEPCYNSIAPRAGAEIFIHLIRK
ncbi:MAG: methyltransferase [Chitinophagaceae bacterium]|nr:methyltransferase [Chitinophagaceae bacterium]MCW5906000.1 methyltransferase [Chitinophagaceae bacterium]